MDEKVKKKEKERDNTFRDMEEKYAQENFELRKEIEELEAQNADLKFKLTCHTRDCIADYEDKLTRIEELEEGIEKYLKKVAHADGGYWESDKELHKLIKKA